MRFAPWIKGGSVLVFGEGVLLAASLLFPSSLQAGAPTFTIDNKVTRNQDYGTGEWIYSDTITQNYTLGWEYKFSSRLRTTTNFKLQLEDNIYSQNVDTKTVTPSLDVALTGNVWDLKLTLKDTIKYTNEFNVPRHDTIDTGVDLNLTPNYLPPLKTSYKINEDYQRGLTDTIDRKLDLSTSYGFGSVITLDGSWRVGEKNDFIRANSDSTSLSWDFNLNYNASFTPALTFAYSNGLKGGRDETLDNQTNLLISSTPVHTINNKAKLGYEGYPTGTSANIEVAQDKTLVTQTVNDTVSFEMRLEQDASGLGTVKEQLRYDYTSNSDPAKETTTGKASLSLEMTGSPYKYLNYSVKLNLAHDDNDGSDPASVSTRTSRKVDMSATLTPAAAFVLDMAYGRELTDENGKKGQSRTFLLTGTVKGTYLDIPELTFNPSLSLTRNYNRADGTMTRNNDLKLDFKYGLSLPTPYLLDLGPSFSWSIADGVTTSQSVALTYKFELRLNFSDWLLDLLINGDFKNDAGPRDGEGKWTLAKEGTAEVSRRLTRTITGNAKYRHKVPSDRTSGKTDSTELGMTWSYLSMGVNLTAARDRTFGGGRFETRKYSAQFTMDF